jgi:hydrogenase maturation protease
MSRAVSTLLVGIGSPFGGDRVGWLVAEEIERRLVGKIDVRCARAPADLLDWLVGVDRLVICDACRDTRQAGTWMRFDWPAVEIADVEFAGTHDMNLPATLKLAERLGLLPKRTTIWGMTVECDSLVRVATGEYVPGDLLESELSPELSDALAALIERIEQELHRA